MAAVLGISAHYHDAAAALVVDGTIVCAAQEERLSRIKNDAALPVHAARLCLETADLGPADLDAVVFYENPFSKIERVLVGLLREVPRTWRQFPRAMASQLGGKLWVLDALAEGLDVPRNKVRFCDHHRSHAASAYYCSPYQDAAVLVLDGVGEHSSTTLWHGSGDTLRGVESIDFPHSIGLLYAALTAYLGFEVNEGEYKVMGLSAWGRPRFREEMQRLVQIHEDGSYTLELSYFDHMTDCELGFGATLERLLGPRRPPGKPWTLDADDLRYADIAASLQATTEDVMLALAGRVRARSGSQHLCLAGGVALNAVANARLQREAGFERVFVQPAAGDAGGALGAAIDVALELGDPRPAALATAALGQRIDAGRAKEVAAALGLEARRVQDPALELAHRIARGDIVALTDGRFEWGPRALGGRSILADPSRRSTRDRLNRLIKQREPFRPFAPAVLEQHAPAWFETEANDMTPYMTTVAPVRAGRREALAAVTHEDGTARLQTVTATSAPALHAVLDQLHAQTGVPVVLNTSLNGPGEPIVGSAEDALAFFLRHKVDALIVEDVLVERKS